jgi:hypothetical protein
MTLNGDILDTVYCENNDELKGTLLDIRFCALNNASVITHEVRSFEEHIVRRDKTHFARRQEDNNKLRFPCKFTYKGTPLYSLISRNKNKIL